MSKELDQITQNSTRDLTYKHTPNQTTNLSIFVLLKALKNQTNMLNTNTLKVREL